MAISDYLTGEEWDACFYLSMGQHSGMNFGGSIHKTIEVLLESGYVFPGLDESGNKKVQVCNGVNAPKLCFLMLGKSPGHHVDILEILDSGRNFLKKWMPSLVDETDEQWDIEMADARAKKEASDAGTRQPA